jgi:flagellar hook-associated protein FlgK
MSDLLSISGNAVIAYQQALGTVSNNIANVATDGYSRQDVKLQAGTPSKVGNAYIGTGVVFDQVQRQFSAFADTNLRNSNSDLQSQAPMVTYANRVIDVMSGASTGLVSSLDRFFASARSLSTNPASTVLRGAFVRDAQGLTSSFGELSSQLDLVDTETSQAIQTGVAQVNTLAQQLAQVNKQLGKSPSLDKQPAELLDQRDLLLRKLSDFSHLNTSFKANGEVLVSLGASLSHDVIVDGGVATQVGVDLNAAASGKISLVLDPYGKPSALSGVTSGQLAGLMAFREQVLSSTRNALDYLATTVVKAVNDIHSQGIDGYGQKAGDLFAMDPHASSVAGGLSVLVTDPMRVAAAAQFRVIKDANNTSSADATVSYAASQPVGPGMLSDLLSNNSNPSAGRSVELTASRPVVAVATIPGGMQDVVLYLDGAQTGQQLQLITRDGRQLLGPPLDAAAQAQVMTAGQGMTAGASYSTAYLNATGDKSFQGMNVFYGARAGVLSQQTYDSLGQPGTPRAVPALLSGGRIAPGQTGTIAAGTLKLNGIALGALTPATGTSLQAGEIAKWINDAGAPGVTASASNEVRVPVANLKLNSSLVINGQTITKPSGGFISSAALVQAINAQTTHVDPTKSTGVVASFSKDGEIVLTNVTTSVIAQQGKDITLGSVASTGNALNTADGTYTGQVQIQRALVTGQETPIEISFGAGGGPSDLAKLGFRTSATIQGGVPEDVLVFVSGVGKASVSASYAGSPADTASVLRSQPMKLTFTADDRYTITDSTTGTVLAERSFDASQLTAGIDYRGLKLNFTTAPKAGDSFALDSNTDGTGNNENMLRLTSLESAKLIAGKTISSTYIAQVNDMGNISKQATIAQQALTVVHDQAVTSRDQISGVSLDEEAANLIRYQQAYQASAKVMQVAGTLFDAVLAVR